MPRSVLLFGNPGVGKSSILNVLLGRNAFKSGLGAGEGVTSEMAVVQEGDVKYFDVPGFSDMNLRANAARAITQALQQAGEDSTIFFVMSMESLRIRPDDVVTMLAVLRASPDIRHYGVIFNKLSSNALQKVATQKDVFLKMAMSIIPPTQRTTLSHFHGKVGQMEDVAGEDVDFTAVRTEFDKLIEFVRRGVPPCRINPGAVKPVDPASFEQMLTNYKALEAEAAKLTEELRLAEEAKQRADEQAARDRADKQKAEEEKRRADERAAKDRADKQKAEEDKRRADERAAKDRADKQRADEQAARDREAKQKADEQAAKDRKAKEKAEEEAEVAKRRPNEAEDTASWIASGVAYFGTALATGIAIAAAPATGGLSLAACTALAGAAGTGTGLAAGAVTRAATRPT